MSRQVDKRQLLQEGIAFEALDNGLLSTPLAPPGDTALRPYFDKLEVAIDRWIGQEKLAA